MYNIADVLYFSDSQGTYTLQQLSISGGTVGSSSLSGLTDVTLSTPTSGQVLTYNGTVWVNSAVTSSVLPQVLQNISSATTTFNVGTTTIDSNSTSYKLVKYDYVIYSGTTNMRGGSITIVNNGTTTKANEVTTEDIGDSTSVTFTTNVNAGNTRLQAVSTTDGWTIKYIKHIV